MSEITSGTGTVGSLSDVVAKVQQYRAEQNEKCDRALSALNELFRDVRMSVEIGPPSIVEMARPSRRRRRGAGARGKRNAAVVKSDRPLSKLQAKAYEAVTAGGRSTLEQLTRKLKISTSHAGGLMTLLIRRGKIKRVGIGVYSRA